MEGKTYSVAPEGEQQFVIADIEDLGTKKIQYKGKPAKWLPRIALYCLSEHTDSEGKMISVREEFTASYYESARLRKFIDKIRGEKRSDEYYKTFDREKLIGANFMGVISHAVTPNRIYANIDSARPYKGNAPLSVPPDYVRKKDRQPREESLPDSEEYAPF